MANTLEHMTAETHAPAKAAAQQVYATPAAALAD